MSHNFIKGNYNRRNMTAEVEGSLNFGAQGATPTVSGITKNVSGFKGLSSVSRSATGTYVLTFDRNYLALNSFNYGWIGTGGSVASGLNLTVYDQNSLPNGTLTLKTFSSGTATDPTNCAVSLCFKFKSSLAG